jgi:hypothetical protein
MDLHGATHLLTLPLKIRELGVWIGNQRYKKKRLTAEKIKQLDDIGFDWGVKRNKWDDMYSWLKDYYKKHGIAYVQRDMSKGYRGNKLNQLNRWCGKQVWYYKRGLLSPDKVSLLKEINFDFNRKDNIIIDYWEQNFEKLQRYKKKFGHCNVPIRWKKDRKLADWVHRQRAYKNKLTKDQIDRLDDIEFPWNSFNFKWEQNFQKLLEYKKINGYCNVYPSQDEKLSDWVKHIRRTRRGKYDYSLSDEHIKRLDEIGFVWEPREKFWQEQYQELRKFKKKFGHCKVKMKYDKTLYVWCRSQRYNIEKLPIDKKKKLDRLGFIW